jgi:hypothetical protein
MFYKIKVNYAVRSIKYFYISIVTREVARTCIERRAGHVAWMGIGKMHIEF